MASGRWSGFRQGMSQAARDIVLSNECSYSVHGPAAEAAAVALTLLEKDSFHFGRTSTGGIDTGAPYQHREVFRALRHFFKGNDSMKDRLPTGIYGPQIPEAMIALTATALEVALLEVAKGMRLTFSEKLQRERYLPHIATINTVKSSQDGARKHARLLSDIYGGTMRAVNGGLPTPIPTEPARESMLDTNRMRV